MIEVFFSTILDVNLNKGFIKTTYHKSKARKKIYLGLIIIYLIEGLLKV